MSGKLPSHLSPLSPIPLDNPWVSSEPSAHIVTSDSQEFLFRVATRHRPKLPSEILDDFLIPGGFFGKDTMESMSS